MLLAAQRRRIAAFTAAALLILFAGQPLHGAATAAAGTAHATASIAADPGVATPGAHHTHLCPLCRAANQARVAITAPPHAVLRGVSFRPFSLQPAPVDSARSIDLCASGPRAPPHLFSPLV
jgi:hypothetical protein